MAVVSSKCKKNELYNSDSRAKLFNVQPLCSKGKVVAFSCKTLATLDTSLILYYMFLRTLQRDFSEKMVMKRTSIYNDV